MRVGSILAVRLLMAGAVAIACYLLWVSLHGTGVAGCGPESICDKVLQSRWSRWFGVPVSALALPLYLIVFGSTFWLRPSTPSVQQRAAWHWLLPCSVAMAGAAIWFTIVQAFLIKGFCPFCTTAHGCALAAAAILLYSAPFQNPPEKARQQEKQVFVPPAMAKKLTFFALGGLALFVAGQLAPVPHREYVVKIFDGKVQMDLREVPVIGRIEAPYTMVSLFDYTCHHCRIMHAHLMEAHRKFSNELAIINLPMPLSEKCNHNVKRSTKAQVYACDYARLGLAVWRADRKAQMQFDDWMFAPDLPPPLSEAKQYASQIAGLVAMEAALKDPWIDRQIQRDVSIYETNYVRGLGNMPQLIIGTNVTSGNFSKVDQLYRLLADNLGLKAAAR